MPISDDNLPYDEAHGWMPLNRHALRYIAVRAESRQLGWVNVRADLKFDKALARTEVEIRHSCYCRGVCPHEHTHHLQWSPYKQE